MITDIGLNVTIKEKKKKLYKLRVETSLSNLVNNSWENPLRAI